MKKLVKKILFVSVLVGGLSVASMAQKGGDKPPPKEKPPVVTPREKPPPSPPKGGGDKGGKKPHGGEAILGIKENKIESA